MDFQSILVTGGAGFIGSNLVRYLLDNTDARVVVLDDLTYAGSLANLDNAIENERMTFYRGNVCDADWVLRIMYINAIDGVMHLAAESHVDRSIAAPAVFAETNIMGTLTMLNSARSAGVKRFLQVSTDEVYGSLGPTGLFREDTPLSPNSPYSASKASADMLVRAFHQTYGMDTVTTRCSNNYGPRQHREKLIPMAIWSALHDKPIPIYGDGLNVRDWIYVNDHCEAMWAAMTRGEPGEAYNIGGNCERTNLEVAKAILTATGKPESLIQFVEDRAGHDRRYAIDATRAREELSWSPRVTFEYGITETVQWYKEQWGDK